MDENKSDRDLVCVLFPGIVKNDEKAVQCLGGIRGLSQIYCNPNKKRLGLSYQPENPYLKKIYADAKKTAGVLLKVKVKKTKSNNEVKREVMSTTVVGRVNTIYKFESMCDFQYLPVYKEGTGPSQPQCILDQILPSGTDTFNFISENAPLFIVPANFTRSDRPMNYAYTGKKYPETDNEDDDIHHRVRSERGVPLARFTFNLTDDLPTEPHEFYTKRKEAKFTLYPQIAEEFNVIKKMFDDRPIMSLNYIKFVTKYKLASLKTIVPCLAIYMRDGPWRMLWVRFGYDPRKNSEARIYQTLDFRLRHAGGIYSMVMTRDQIFHYKKANRVRHVKKKTTEISLSEEVSEGVVFFRPGIAPAQRQIFYQYCDVKLREVEELLSTEPPPGYLCHEKRGWLPPNTEEFCRDHIFRYVKETLLSTHNADMKFEQGSSDEELNSDDDDGTMPSTAELEETSNAPSTSAT